MEKKICTVCKKRFTRQWNLARHLKDIHNISDYGENDVTKRKNDRFMYSSIYQMKKEPLRNSDNQMNEMNHYPNTPQYHNFTQGFASDICYNNGIYQRCEFVPKDKKEPKLTIKDGIRIKTAFQILQNVLPRFYPNTAVNRVICWLKYQCNTKHTDEPLKDFFKMYHIWHLWPDKWIYLV